MTTDKKSPGIVNAAPYVGIREVGLDGKFIGERKDLFVWDPVKKCLVAPENLKKDDKS